MLPSLPIPFSFSQSSLQDYTDCARRFELRYIERLAWPAIETEPTLENERRQQAGQAFHRMAQQAIIGLPLEKLEKLATSPELGRWWQNFCEAYPVLGYGKKLFPEISLSAPLGAHRLTAKYDLIAISDEKATIYDWKTSHKRTRTEILSARWQTRVYRYLLVEAGKHLNGGSPFRPENIEMIYWFADFPNESAKFTYNEAQHRLDGELLLKIISEISQSSQFQPIAERETDKKCAFCAYRSYCARGIRAGDWQESENEPDPIPEIVFGNILEIEL